MEHPPDGTMVFENCGQLRTLSRINCFVARIREQYALAVSVGAVGSSPFVVIDSLVTRVSPATGISHHERQVPLSRRGLLQLYLELHSVSGHCLICNAQNMRND